MGGQKGPVFYIYYERITGHRSKWKFFPKGVSFYPSISPFTMREYEGYACKSLLPTNGEGGKSLEEENILSETGIIGPAFSPFIMKGYAGHAWKPYRFESESEEIDVTHKNDSGSGGLVQKPGPADLPDRDRHPHAAAKRARPLCPGR